MPPPAEAQTLLDAHPDWLTELRVLFLNVRAQACMKDGDLDTPTAVLPRALHMAVAAKLHTATRYTAMTLADVLRRTDRCEEALAMLDLGLHAVDAPDDLITLQCHVMQLRVEFPMGRFDEALVEAASTLARCRRFSMPAVYEVLALGLAAFTFNGKKYRADSRPSTPPSKVSHALDVSSTSECSPLAAKVTINVKAKAPHAMS
jgi:MalT-like TPR region